MGFSAGSGAVITFGVDGTEQVQRQIRSIGEAMVQAGRPTAAMTAALDQYSGATAALTADLAGVTARQTAANASFGATAPALAEGAVSAKQMAAALRGLPAQLTDIVVSLQGGQAPLTVLLQQGGQIAGLFGGVASAARALGGYVVGLINPFTVAAAAASVLSFAYYQGSQEASAYRNALVLSGNAAGVSAGQMADMARSISSVGGTQAAAAGALTALVDAGRVGADNLQRFGAVAVQAEAVLGIGAADMAKNFAELGKSPLQASEKLSERYNYLTAAVYQQIKALQDQGRSDEAAEVAQNAYADAVEVRTKGIKANLGTLEAAWKSVGGWAKGAWDAMLNVGREDSVSQQIDALQAKIEKAERNRYSFTGGSREALAELQALRDKQATLQAGQIEERKANEAKAASIKLDADRISWMKDGEKYLSRAAQLEMAITKARNEGAAAQQSGAEIERRVGDIRKGYADIFNDGIDSQIEAIKRRGGIEEIVAKRSMDLLASSKAAGLVGESDYLQKVADLNQHAFEREEARLKQELALTAGKQNSLKDQAALHGQIAEIEAKAISARIQLTNDLFVVQTKAEREVFNQILQSTAARQAANDALAVEYAYYGKSADARELAMIALKAQAEVDKYIADQQRANAPLSDEMIGQLRAEAAERTRVTQATTAQGKALGYAQQLADENKRFAAEAIFDERERAAAILQIDAAMWQDRIRLAGEGTEAQRLLQEQYSTWYQNQSNKPMLDQWKKSVGQYDDIFRTGFADMLNNGKTGWASFTKSLTTTFKTSVADQIYKMFAQPFVVKLVASMLGVQGGGIGGVAQAANGAGGLTSAAGILQAASSAYSAITAGFSGLSTAVADGVQSALYATGASDALLVNGTFATAVGTAAGYAGGLAGGKVLGSAISGDYGIGNHGSAVVNIASVAGAIFGGPIGGAIGGAVGGLLNRAFGMGSKNVTGSGVRGTLDANGFSGQAYSDWHQKGGWFRSDKNGTDTAAVDAGISKSLGDGYAAILKSTGDFAKVLGVNADAIGARAQSLDIKLGADAAANQKALTDFFTGVGDTVARELVPSLDQFSKSGEVASATLQRLATDYVGVDAVLGVLGKTSEQAFGAAGLASVAMREQLITASGGMDTLAKQAGSFAQNYLTEAERLAPAVKMVGEKMAALGYASVTTREQFKQLVRGLDISTQAGAQQYAALMALAEAFAQVHPAVEATTAAVNTEADVLRERADLQKQLDEATLSSAELLGRQRAALDASNRALFDQVQAATAAKAAAESLKTVNAGYQQQIDDLLKASMSSAQVRALEIKGMDASTVALYDRLAGLKSSQAAAAAAADAIKTAQDSAAAGIQSFGNALVDSITRAKDAAKAFRALNDSLLLGDSSMLSPEQKYIEAKRQYEAADDNGLQAAERTFLEASKAWFGGSAGSAADFTAVLARNSQAAANSDAQAAAIPGIWQAVMASINGVNGSHANGLDYVPFDGYRAELHRGERVQTAAAVRNGDAAMKESTVLLRQLVAEAQADKPQRAAIAAQQDAETRALRAEVSGLKRKLATLELA